MPKFFSILKIIKINQITSFCIIVRIHKGNKSTPSYTVKIKSCTDNYGDGLERSQATTAYRREGQDKIWGVGLCELMPQQSETHARWVPAHHRLERQIREALGADKWHERCIHGRV